MMRWPSLMTSSQANRTFCDLRHSLVAASWVAIPMRGGEPSSLLIGYPPRIPLTSTPPWPAGFFVLWAFSADGLLRSCAHYSASLGEYSHNTFGRSGQIRSQRWCMLCASRFGQPPFSCFSSLVLGDGRGTLTLKRPFLAVSFSAGADQ